MSTDLANMQGNGPENLCSQRFKRILYNTQSVCVIRDLAWQLDNCDSKPKLNEWPIPRTHSAKKTGVKSHGLTGLTSTILALWAAGQGLSQAAELELRAARATKG